MMTYSIDIAALREAEISWLTDALGAAIANLGYPVGCGVAPNREQLLRAASTLIDRYLLMVEMAAGQRDALNVEIEQLRAERDELKAELAANSLTAPAPSEEYPSHD